MVHQPTDVTCAIELKIDVDGWIGDDRIDRSTSVMMRNLMVDAPNDSRTISKSRPRFIPQHTRAPFLLPLRSLEIRQFLLDRLLPHITLALVALAQAVRAGLVELQSQF